MNLADYQSIPTYFAVLFCAALVGSSSADALAEQLPGTPTLPGELCQISPRSAWSPQERWVWNGFYPVSTDG